MAKIRGLDRFAAVLARSRPDCGSGGVIISPSPGNEPSSLCGGSSTSGAYVTGILAVRLDGPFLSDRRRFGMRPTAFGSADGIR
jgi:hypothetical protein